MGKINVIKSLLKTRKKESGDNKEFFCINLHLKDGSEMDFTACLLAS